MEENDMKKKWNEGTKQWVIKKQHNTRKWRRMWWIHVGEWDECAMQGWGLGKSYRLLKALSRNWMEALLMGVLACLISQCLSCRGTYINNMDHPNTPAISISVWRIELGPISFHHIIILDHTELNVEWGLTVGRRGRYTFYIHWSNLFSAFDQFLLARSRGLRQIVAPVNRD